MSITSWVFILLGVIIVIWLVRRGASNKTSESELRKQWRQQADSSGLMTTSKNPVCDICSKPVNISDCYNLTNEQVTTKEAYWNFAFTHQWAYIHGRDPQGGIIASLAQQQAGQSTAWSVCESCSHMFQFDREAARRYAQQLIIYIPGGGPADINRVSLAAANAWKKLYGSYPSSIIVQ